MITKEEIQKVYKGIQENIVAHLKRIDPQLVVHEDIWDRAEGGGGTSMAMSGDGIIAKGGVNFSAVHGPTPKKILEALKLEKADFFATGVSIVLHPNNPLVPIIHMNIRYFEMTNGVYWFGGGIDLTPHYVNKEEAKMFHQTLKQTCDKTDSQFYPKFKKQADDYFFIKHRDETRGVGGIFYDHLNAKSGYTKDQLFEFSKNVGNSFILCYEPLATTNASKTFTPKQKEWQMVRRGRYVEFNLVWDKGTKFGLDTNGRTESILVSMPPEAKWEYMYSIEKDSEEQKTLDLLKKDIDWL